MKTAQTIYA